jgi:hypothetical protein
VQVLSAADLVQAWSRKEAEDQTWLQVIYLNIITSTDGLDATLSVQNLTDSLPLPMEQIPSCELASSQRFKHIKSISSRQTAAFDQTGTEGWL